MEINRQSKLVDVLETYPFLEQQLMDVAPLFKNLKNPILRRTMGKLATVETAAQIGQVNADDLVNLLRKAAGQVEFNKPVTATDSVSFVGEGKPGWISGEPQFILNGTEMLQRGEVPLVKVNELLALLSSGRYLLLIANFEPSPIWDAMQKQGRLLFHQTNPADAVEHLTFIG